MRSFAFVALSATAYAFGEQLIPQLIQADGDSWTTLTITEDGEAKSVYLATPTWFDGQGGNSVVIPEGGRLYFSTTPQLDPETFYKPNLLGGSVEFDVDMGPITCGCNAALYLVRAPAKDSSGNYAQTDGFYYCDAQGVGGAYCPEFDIMEANKYAWQTTAHPCSTPYNGHYDSNCEHGGLCIQSSVDNWNHQGINNYGPGGQYQINTDEPFRYKIEFAQDSNGQFASFSQTWTQGDKTVTGGCTDGSNNRMTEDLTDMVFALSNWGNGSDMSWLDKDACYGSCASPDLVISNIAIKTSGATPPTPTPTPTPDDCNDCQYGDACSSKSDDDCDGQCDCRWSWPGDDPAQWASANAHCRCKP